MKSDHFHNVSNAVSVKKIAVSMTGKRSGVAWGNPLTPNKLRPEESRSICDDELIVMSLLHLLHQQCLRGLILQTALRKEFAEHQPRTKQIASVWLLRPQVHSN